MNLLGITLSTPRLGPPPATRLLTLGFLYALVLTGCGSGNQEAKPQESSTASTSASSIDTPSSPTSKQESSATPENSSSASAESKETEPAVAENNAAAETLAQAKEVSPDTAEVKEAEALYSDVHEVFSALEPAVVLDNANASEQQSQSSESAEAQASEPPAPQYLSDETIKNLESHATGAALEQYIATALEYAVSGWRTEGKPTVVGTPRMADGEYMGQPAKILEVCLDSSEVRLLDSQGRVINSSQFPRSLNIFTLTQDKGAWKIASHDFPNEADC